MKELDTAEIKVVSGGRRFDVMVPTLWFNRPVPSIETEALAGQIDVILTRVPRILSVSIF